MEIFIRPTPQQFLLIAIIYLILVSFLGYLLAGGWIAFMGGVGGLQMLGFIYKLSQDKKVRDKGKAQKEWFIYFATPLVMAWFLGINQGAFFRSEFILDKTQLTQITGIVPDTYTKRETGGKNRRTYYYLTIDHVNLHCSEDDYDDCDNIYAYKGKTATVYYQSGTKNGNLAYEIIVDGVPIYKFDHQLANFQSKRNKENSQYIWAFVLYFLPMFYFVYAHRQAVEYIDEMDENEKVNYDLKAEFDNLNNERISAKDYGVLGFILYWFGLFCIVLAIIALIVLFFKQTLVLFLLFLILIMIGGVCTYFPYQTAKENYNERIAIKQEELNERFVQINPTPIITQKPIPRPPNPNRVIFPKRANQSISDSNEVWQDNKNSIDKKETNIDNDDYDDEDKIERISLSDFGWLNGFVLVVGVSVLLTTIWLFFNDTKERTELYTVLYYGFTLIFVLGSLIMIYKPIANARYNRDLRSDLCEEVWVEDKETEYSLWYGIFRLLALFFLIPLFLWLVYVGLHHLLNWYFLGILSTLFWLIATGYGIRKLW